MNILKEQDKQKKKFIKNLLRKYSSKFDIYSDFAENIKRLATLFLKSAEINFQSVSSRPKDVYNLKQKIKRKWAIGRVYNSLEEISDLAGTRIIVYFKSDIDRVLKILNQEFIVHAKENVDKNYVSGGAGYTSIHRIVSLRKKQGKLKEYDRFMGLKCEIQIRTVLQHAWAEIEHSIGYKPIYFRNAVARNKTKNLFNANAKLLELADDNFVAIKNNYDQLVSHYRTKMSMKKLDIPINYQSVELYLSKKLNFQKIPEAKKNLLITEYLELAKTARINTIKELNGIIKKDKAQLNLFIR